jgi:hypothetical protein
LDRITGLTGSLIGNIGILESWNILFILSENYLKETPSCRNLLIFYHQ